MRAVARPRAAACAAVVGARSAQRGAAWRPARANAQARYWRRRICLAASSRAHVPPTLGAAMVLTVARMHAALSVQAAPEKSERKVLAIPSIVEKVKAAAPQKLDYGLDYYRKFLPKMNLQSQLKSGLVWSAGLWAWLVCSCLRVLGPRRHAPAAEEELKPGRNPGTDLRARVSGECAESRELEARGGFGQRRCSVSRERGSRHGGRWMEVKSVLRRLCRFRCRLCTGAGRW